MFDGKLCEGCKFYNIFFSSERVKYVAFISKCNEVEGRMLSIFTGLENFELGDNLDIV